MLSMWGYLSLDRDLKNLSSAISTLNSEIMARERFLHSSEIQKSENIAEKFVWQYLQKQGDLYEKVEKAVGNGNSVAKRIISCAANIANTVDNKSWERDSETSTSSYSSTEKSEVKSSFF